MKKYIFLHFGFERPTSEIMSAWKAWFESIAERQLGQGVSLVDGKSPRRESRICLGARIP